MYPLKYILKFLTSLIQPLIILLKVGGLLTQVLCHVVYKIVIMIFMFVTLVASVALYSSEMASSLSS